MTEDMVDDGYTSVTNIDISRVVIDQMKEKYKEFTYKQMNVCSLDFPDATFDCVIAKGLMDAILCGEGSTANVAKMCQEVSRVLTSNGTSSSFVVSRSQVSSSSSVTVSRRIGPSTLKAMTIRGPLPPIPYRNQRSPPPRPPIPKTPTPSTTSTSAKKVAPTMKARLLFLSSLLCSLLLSVREPPPQKSRGSAAVREELTLLREQEKEQAMGKSLDLGAFRIFFLDLLQFSKEFTLGRGIITTRKSLEVRLVFH